MAQRNLQHIVIDISEHFQWNWPQVNAAGLNIYDKSILVQVMVWCRGLQAITWTHVDQVIFRQMVSLGDNELFYQSFSCRGM